MRILHVVPTYYPAVRYGGPIRSVQGLAAACAAAGHDVHVYTTNIDGPGVCDVPVGVPVDLDGVKVWYFPLAALGRKVFRSPALGRALEKTIASFDVVHIHYVWVWTTIAAAAAARRYRVPYLLSPRGMLVADLIRRRSRVAKTIWLALFDRQNVRDAAALHATSEGEAADIDALGLATRHIAVIPNGVELPAKELPESAGDVSVSVRAIDEGGRYILFLGRISWKKGLDRLLRSLPSVCGAELVIAGYDEDGYWASIERLAHECGVAGRIRFVGAVEGDAKWALLRGAACLVLPSYNENFGMSVVEAMAVGCPVIVTAEVGLSAVVAKTGCGVVASDDPGGLAHAINSLLSDDVRARTMGAIGHRVAREQFGWRGVAERMLVLYGECLQPEATAQCRSGRGPLS